MISQSTIKQIIKEELKKKLNEDGHIDVPSAVRKLKLSIEDSQEMLEKLSTMSPEDSLPAWWMDKISIASNNLNKSRDYLLTSGEVSEGQLNEAKETIFDVAKRVIKDWMSKAKSGVIDFFDLVRGFERGDASRAYPYETDFLMSVLTKDKIIDRFRKYFGGKKGKRIR